MVWILETCQSQTVLCHLVWVSLQGKYLYRYWLYGLRMMYFRTAQQQHRHGNWGPVSWIFMTLVILSSTSNKVLHRHRQKESPYGARKVVCTSLGHSLYLKFGNAMNTCELHINSDRNCFSGCCGLLCSLEELHLIL